MLDVLPLIYFPCYLLDENVRLKGIASHPDRPALERKNKETRDRTVQPLYIGNCIEPILASEQV